VLAAATQAAVTKGKGGPTNHAAAAHTAAVLAAAAAAAAAAEAADAAAHAAADAAAGAAALAAAPKEVTPRGPCLPEGAERLILRYVPRGRGRCWPGATPPASSPPPPPPAAEAFGEGWIRGGFFSIAVEPEEGAGAEKVGAIAAANTSLGSNVSSISPSISGTSSHSSSHISPRLSPRHSPHARALRERERALSK